MRITIVKGASKQLISIESCPWLTLPSRLDKQ